MKQLNDKEKLKTIQILQSYHIPNVMSLPEKLARYGIFVSLKRVKPFLKELERMKLVHMQHGRLTLNYGAEKIFELYSEKCAD